MCADGGADVALRRIYYDAAKVTPETINFPYEQLTLERQLPLPVTSAPERSTPGQVRAPTRNRGSRVAKRQGDGYGDARAKESLIRLQPVLFHKAAAQLPREDLGSAVPSSNQMPADPLSQSGTADLSQSGTADQNVYEQAGLAALSPFYQKGTFEVVLCADGAARQGENPCKGHEFERTVVGARVSLLRLGAGDRDVKLVEDPKNKGVYKHAAGVEAGQAFLLGIAADGFAPVSYIVLVTVETSASDAEKGQVKPSLNLTLMGIHLTQVF